MQTHRHRCSGKQSEAVRRCQVVPEHRIAASGQLSGDVERADPNTRSGTITGNMIS